MRHSTARMTLRPLTKLLSQIIRDDLLLVVLLALALADLLGLLGHEELLDFVKNTLSTQLKVLLFPLFSGRRVGRPMGGKWRINLFPVQGLELLLRPDNWQA